MALAKESLISHLRANRLQAFGLLLCITAVLSTPWARGAEQRSEVFHLGRFDSSSQEFHSGQPDQHKVIEFYGREVLPQLKEGSRPL